MVMKRQKCGKERHPFFCNGTVARWNGIVVDSNSTIVGGTGDEYESLLLYFMVIEKQDAILCCTIQ